MANSFAHLQGSGGTGTGTGSSGGSNGHYASNLSINNLTFTYASDQITVTSLQQASSFKDDSMDFGSHANYVRVNLKEQGTAQDGSFFDYMESFHLVLPDKSVVALENSQSDTGPDQAVVRTNWLDFGTDAQVDLTKLTLLVGASGEAQMNIPLQSGADLSSYQPKTTTLNKPFLYAHMNWTLVSATTSLSFDGNQAKTGQIYITLNFRTDNNSNYEFFAFGGGFMRLQSGSTVVSPDDGSNMSAYDDV
jgi:hypothetical protein